MMFLAARMVGLALIGGALVALVIDGSRIIASSALSLTSLGLAWSTISPATLLSAQEFVRKEIGAWLWDSVIEWILRLPAFAVLAILGGALAYLGRRSRRKADSAPSAD